MIRVFEMTKLIEKILKQTQILKCPFSFQLFFAERTRVFGRTRFRVVTAILTYNVLFDFLRWQNEDITSIKDVKLWRFVSLYVLEQFQVQSVQILQTKISNNLRWPPKQFATKNIASLTSSYTIKNMMKIKKLRRE